MSSATGSIRNVRRWIVWVAVLLLAGALVNVAVAWGYALRAQVIWGNSTVSHSPQPWPAWVPDDWPPPDNSQSREALGFRVDESSAALVRGAGGINPPHYVVAAYRSGWPFPCMGWTLWWHRVTPSSNPITAGFPPQNSWWHWGMPIPEWMRTRAQLWHHLPVRPLPLPFLANALFYAAALAAPVLGVALLRKRLRKRAGHCARCGYDLRELPAGAPCPECGAEAIGC